jgi:WD40 repeat protein
MYRCLSAAFFVLLALSNISTAEGAETPPKVSIRTDRETGAHIAFSPDGKQVLTSGNETVLWDVEADKEIAAFAGMTGGRRASIRGQAVAFNSDGKQVAIGGDEVKSWDVADRKPTASWSAKALGGTVLAISPDFQHVIVQAGSSRQLGKIRRLADGKDLGQVEGHHGYIESASFSADSKFAITVSWDPAPEILVWDVAADKQSLAIRPKGMGFTSAALLPDNKSLFVIMARMLHVFDASTGKELRSQAITASSAAPDFMAISPDGKLLLARGASGAGRELIVLDTQTGKEKARLITKTGDIKTGTFSPDGKMVAAFAGGALRLWDVEEALGRRKKP